MLSVIIPANNEEDWIGRCLGALAVQGDGADRIGGVEIVVAANGCTDRTVALAEAERPRIEARGWRLVVLDIARGNKSNALNEADAAAAGAMRAYLDADVVLGPAMLERLHAALDRPEPAYASGRLRVAPARSWVTRRYAALWQRLPFVTEGVPGAGLFAVNAAGRARWDRFPDIISDDTFARLQFAPAERHLADEVFDWPMVEGFAALVRVRRRQDAGVSEVAAHYPALMANEGKRPVSLAEHLGLAARLPLSYAVYVAVALAVRVQGRRDVGWLRGGR